MTTEQPTGWEIAAANLGYEGMTATEAGRSTHLLLLPMWEAHCTCWRDHPEKYRTSTRVLASEHVRCHQKTCDLHDGAIARWEEHQRKAARAVHP